MRKLLPVLMVFALLGCKSNPSTKLDNRTEASMRGNWTITSVNFPGMEVLRVQSFHLADSQCLVGSQWRLVSNNNTGSMTLNNSGCPSFSSNITWKVNREGNFVFKILDDNRARTVKSGYVLQVANITDSGFQLIDRVNIGGQMTNITYQFQKN